MRARMGLRNILFVREREREREQEREREKGRARVPMTAMTEAGRRPSA